MFAQTISQTTLNSNSINNIGSSLLLAASLLLSACNHTLVQNDNAASTDFPCQLPQSKQLSGAIEQSRITLAQAQCQPDFEQHFAVLVDIASCVLIVLGA